MSDGSMTRRELFRRGSEVGGGLLALPLLLNEEPPRRPRPRPPHLDGGGRRRAEHRAPTSTSRLACAR